MNILAKLQIAGIIASVVGVLLLCIAIVIVVDYNTVGETIYSESIMVEDTTVGPPMNYKSQFATVKYVYNPAVDKAEMTVSVASPSVDVEVFRSGPGVIADDGMTQWAVASPSEITAVTQIAMGTAPSESERLKALYNAVETLSDDGKLCVPANTDLASLTIAIFQNCMKEGYAAQWESACFTEGNEKYNILKETCQLRIEQKADDGGRYHALVWDSTKNKSVDIATKVITDPAKNAGLWMITCAGQIQNLYELGSKHPLYTNSRGNGIGIVQWSGPRCWSYVRFMYDLLQNGKLQFNDAHSVYNAELAFFKQDYYSRLKGVSTSDLNYKSVACLTAWICAYYECPRASRYISIDGDEYFRNNRKIDISRNAFWNGSISDEEFKTYTYTITYTTGEGDRTMSMIAEATRARAALSNENRWRKILTGK